MTLFNEITLPGSRNDDFAGFFEAADARNYAALGTLNVSAADGAEQLELLGEGLGSTL